MLRSVFTASLSLSLFFCFAQSKEIEINQWLRHTVPKGKVLELTNVNFYKLILSDGVFRSGSSCNAIIQSNPKYIYGISYYDGIENNARSPKTIGFTFKEIKHYEDDVYLIKPHFLLEENMDANDIARSLTWKYRPQRIIFYPGTTVFPSSCIRSILLTETYMTSQEKATYNEILNKRIKLQKEEERQREREEEQRQQQARKAIIDKYDDINSIYSARDILNLEQLKLSDSILTPLLKFVALKIDRATHDEFIKTENKDIYGNSISVTALWNNSGDIISLNTEKDKSSSYNTPTISLNTENDKSSSYMVPIIDLYDKGKNVHLGEYLNLKKAPLVKFEDKTRTCYFNDCLFTIKYFVSANHQISIKKKRGRIKYTQDNDPALKKEFEETFSAELNNLPDGNHSFSFYTVNYKFNLLSELFDDKSTVTIKRGVIVPNQLKSTNKITSYIN